jgi:hypothetical protein
MRRKEGTTEMRTRTDDQIDQAWDAFVNGTPGDAQLDPAVFGTIRRIHALDGGPSVAPRRNPALTNRPWIAAAPRARAGSGARGPRALSRAVSGVAMAVLLVVMVAGAMLSVGKGMGGSNDLSIWAIDLASGRAQPLDPVTLDDQPGEVVAIYDRSGDENFEMLASGDGSTIIYLSSLNPEPGQEPPPTVVEVIDRETGTPRTRIALTESAWPVAVSPDGSTLVMRESTVVDADFDRYLSSTFLVYETATGTLVTTVQSANMEVAGPSAQIDPTGERLYLLTADRPANGYGEWPVAIEAYDLLTGAMLGRVSLPSIVEVVEEPNLSVNDRCPARGEPPTESLQLKIRVPSFTISPDGAGVTVVSSDGRSYQTLDTTTLTLSTPLIEIGQVAAPAEDFRLGCSITLSQQSRAQYTADGAGLFISTWQVAEVEARAMMANQDANGLWLVDAKTGKLLARNSLKSPRGSVQVVWSIYIAPAGEDVYLTVLSLDQPLDDVGTPTAAPQALPIPPELSSGLIRLDIDTLMVEAQRFDAGGRLSLYVVAPSGAND